MASVTQAYLTGASVTVLITIGDGLAKPLPASAHFRSQHCVLFAVDIVGFNDAGRDDEVQIVLRKVLYDILIGAFAASGIRWDSCTAEDRGDGVMIVIPAQMPTITIVHPLTAEIGSRLRRHNRMSSEIAQIRLRLAAHIGEVHHDRYGLAGAAINQLFRMLDAPALRDAVRVADSELALLISDYLYNSVICGRASMVDPAVFRPVSVQVKQFRGRAWLLADVA
jgi:hypothetical protein